MILLWKCIKALRTIFFFLFFSFSLMVIYKMKHYYVKTYDRYSWRVTHLWKICQVWVSEQDIKLSPYIQSVLYPDIRIALSHSIPRLSPNKCTNIFYYKKSNLNPNISPFETVYTPENHRLSAESFFTRKKKKKC